MVPLVAFAYNATETKRENGRRMPYSVGTRAYDPVDVIYGCAPENAMRVQANMP